MRIRTVMILAGIASTPLHRVRRSAPTWVMLMATVGGVAHAGILFQDNFSTPGTQLNLAAWTTEVGPPSFLGRTQLADWVTPGGVGKFVVGSGGAQLTLNTFNPTGFSFYGTHGKTLMSFVPRANTTIEFNTRLQLTSLQRGLVYGMYLYGCDPATCATRHDEIDIELLTNYLQPGGSPLMVQLNRYADEPPGVGNGGLVNLPAGFDPLAAHVWTIRWSATRIGLVTGIDDLTRIDYLVDGVFLSSATTHVPRSPMQANVIAWAPAEDWGAAFDSSLQPVTTAARNQSFTALLTSISVNETTPAGIPPSIAVFRTPGALGVWVLDNGSYGFDAGDKSTFFGLAGDQPVVGDWTGNGQTRLGVFRAGLWYLDLNNNGQWDGVGGGDGIFAFGLPGDLAVVGDWNGDGRTKLGIFRCPTIGACTWALDYAGKFAYDPGTVKVLSYGLPGDTPVANNWNGSSNVDQIGVYRPMPNGLGLWIVDSNGSGAWEPSDAVYQFGLAQDIPVVGNWNSGTRKRVGVFRNGMWAFDSNGNNAYDSSDAVVFFGLTGDKPAFGYWTIP